MHEQGGHGKTHTDKESLQNVEEEEFCHLGGI